MERISADSLWAHRASGIRASLVKILTGEKPSSGADPEGKRLLEFMRLGFAVLEAAAAQVPGDD